MRLVLRYLIFILIFNFYSWSLKGCHSSSEKYYERQHFREPLVVKKLYLVLKYLQLITRCNKRATTVAGEWFYLVFDGMIDALTSIT